MMVFPDYEKEKLKYERAIDRCGSIINEKEKLFARTQPNAVQFDKEKVTSSNVGNSFDDYVIEKERKRIDERLKEAQSIVTERKKMFQLKEQELRKSKEILDVVYTLKYLDGMGVYKIADDIGYSKSQVYRVLDKIAKKRDKRGQIGTK